MKDKFKEKNILTHIVSTMKSKKKLATNVDYIFRNLYIKIKKYIYFF